jgi:erythromycin esterase
MADNLLWLAREAYPDRKIIVWAATYHSMRNAQTIQSDYPDLDYSEAVSMGHLLSEQLGDAVYTVACTPYEGSFGNIFWDNPMDLEPAPGDSLEGLWAATKHDKAFVDLRHLPTSGAWLQAEQLGRAAFAYRPVRANWSQIVDGLVFLRTMTRATRV